MNIKGKLEVTWELSPDNYGKLREVITRLNGEGVDDDTFWESVLGALNTKRVGFRGINCEHNSKPLIPITCQKKMTNTAFSKTCSVCGNAICICSPDKYCIDCHFNENCSTRIPDYQPKITPAPVDSIAGTLTSACSACTRTINNCPTCEHRDELSSTNLRVNAPDEQKSTKKYKYPDDGCPLCGEYPCTCGHMNSVCTDPNCICQTKYAEMLAPDCNTCAYKNQPSRNTPLLETPSRDTSTVLAKEYQAGYDTGFAKASKNTSTTKKSIENMCVKAFDKGYEKGFATGEKETLSKQAEHGKEMYQNGLNDGEAIANTEQIDEFNLIYDVANERRCDGNNPPLTANDRKFRRISEIVSTKRQKTNEMKQK